MKHAVVTTELRGSDLRPPGLLTRLRELSREESATYFGAPGAMEGSDCPACGEAERQPAFDRTGFHYHVCQRCGTLYISPRPTVSAMREYDQESRAGRYRAEYLSRDTASARRDVLRSRSSWVGRLVDEVRGTSSGSYADLGTVYPALLEEVAGLDLFDSVAAVDPFPGLDPGLLPPGVAHGDSAPSGLSALTAFEQLERQPSPIEFLQRAVAMLEPGGLLFLTTRSASGFDVRILWDAASHIFVPEHLNLPTTEGMEALLDRVGLEVVELSTPGQLDLEIVQRARREEGVALPPFAEYLLGNRDQRVHAEFQEFLQKSRLSSHLRVAAQKR